MNLFILLMVNYFSKNAVSCNYLGIKKSNKMKLNIFLVKSFPFCSGVNQNMGLKAGKHFLNCLLWLNKVNLVKIQLKKTFHIPTPSPTSWLFILIFFWFSFISFLYIILVKEKLLQVVIVRLPVAMNRFCKSCCLFSLLYYYWYCISQDFSIE